MQRRFDRQFKKRIAGAKHARLMKKKPELRQQLYGGQPPDRPAASSGDASNTRISKSRETAQLKETDNG